VVQGHKTVGGLRTEPTPSACWTRTPFVVYFLFFSRSTFLFFFLFCFLILVLSLFFVDVDSGGCDRGKSAEAEIVSAHDGGNTARREKTIHGTN
jgi:hypothetical protein